MTDLQRSRGFLPKIFSFARGKTDSSDAASGITTGPIVRLVNTRRREAVTVIELQIVSMLKEAGSVSHDHLVQRVARDLYEGELRRGAAVVDIGLFGSRLFEHEVVETLKHGDGALWEIA